MRLRRAAALLAAGLTAALIRDLTESSALVGRAGAEPVSSPNIWVKPDEEGMSRRCGESEKFFFP